MKILYHHRTQGRGAEGVHIREIVKTLRNLGNEVFVVSPPGIDIFEEDSLRVNEFESYKSKNKKYLFTKLNESISKHFPQIGFEILELAYNLVAYKNIKRLLSKHKIDFIYERYAFFNWMGIYLAKKYNIPIILEVNEVSGIKRLRGQILIRLAKIIERRIFNKVDTIVTVSSFLKKHIENMGIDSGKIYVAPNAVNIEEFNPNIKGIEIRNRFKLNGKTVLGFVGHFSWWDNLEFLVNTFSEIIREKTNLHLMLVGDGSDRNKLEYETIKKGMGGNITFTGRVDRQLIPNFIAATDVCVIPHSNPFGSPIVLFEYMAMEKPVVAPKLGPIEDVIIDNVNGLLFELKNKCSFKRCLLDLINDEQKRRRLGKEARNIVLSKHLWKHNAERIIQIYSRVKRKC